MRATKSDADAEAWLRDYLDFMDPHFVNQLMANLKKDDKLSVLAESMKA